MRAPSNLYIDNPPPSEQRIDALHVWIATYADGSEGIVSADLPLASGLGMRHMPLMSSKRELVERMEPLARSVQKAAVRQAKRITKLDLVTYRREPA